MLAAMNASADAAPTRQSQEVLDLLSRQVDEQLEKLDRLFTRDIPAFNDAIRRLNVPAILPKTEKELSTAAAD
jgi:hypothetical protein